jgi:hypothetical protein
MTSNVVMYNLGFGNPDGDFDPIWNSSTTFSTGAGNITGLDPQFVGRSSKDYRLQSSSPAIGKANPAYAPSVDFSGKSRDSSPDIGAFEY